ncbi:MAG: flavodoxin family protein [Clostridiales bacterium]|nr:flavodoxin family protein [Clostridiales bacterium]
MKIIAFNGSPKRNGNTYHALKIACDVLEAQGFETEIVCVGERDIPGCKACGGCDDGNCVFGDEWFKEMTQKAIEADGIILGSPVYYASINGTMKAFLDRLFFQRGMKNKLRHKVGGAVSICRRAGSVSTFDHLNHYFTISEIIVAPSTYWNIGIGMGPGDFTLDREGVSTMVNMAKNMAWLLKMKEATKDIIEEP